MRRVIAVALLALSLGACDSEPNSVSHVVRYELNMIGQRAFADINAIYTYEDMDMPFETDATVFAASWSHEVTVRYPHVKVVRLQGTFRFDTSVPGEPTNPMQSSMRCRITVDGVLVADRTAYSPTCSADLPTTTP